MFKKLEGENPTKNYLTPFKIYDENNNLVRDFTPCCRKSDGVRGMYDYVEGKFYELRSNNNVLSIHKRNNNKKSTKSINN